MKTSRRPARSTVEDCRLAAAHLLKDLRSGESLRIERAVARIRAMLPHLGHAEFSAGRASRREVRRKHALATVAAELGYASWADCRRRLAAPAAQRFDPESLFTPTAASFLNRWFATYAEARASLDRDGGYLFPFRRQFFLCEPGFLEVRGIDPADPDWALIGFDWLRPFEESARLRLELRLIASGYGTPGT